MKRPLSSLNLLRTFEVAGRHLSFTLAADELCITPSAVSQQMRKLEEDLGVALFERQPRGLILSESGERYWRDIQQHLDGIDRSTRALTRQSSRTLRVSLMPPLASRIVLPRLTDFQQRHPDIELRLDASLRYADLGKQDIDLAIRFGQPPWPGCVHEKLLDLYVLPVCPPAMASEHDLSHHPERLAQLPLIQMTERADSWTRFFAMSGLGKPCSDKQFFVDDYPAAIEAAETVGVALAILPLEQPLLDSKRLAAPWPALGPLPESVYAVMREDQAERTDIQTFLNWLKTQLDSLPAAVK
ncbi:LysR substrate-binding domain-containing protein [Alcanivorax sp. 1008]|uniref:LysR substrate-binding domain-containing protein n=1 Tax=Alcanivorax sp. 1008 TaxID=2816853 RepID=UPI001DCCF98A|nr:LysR substrate-binding domain-containing protein [Alcanivorax sp. 1008]MCC1496652.1 LysR family transcriptional regulator [Alcanivorax sp. 1008]